MNKITVDVSCEQDLVWPQFCVLCLKPNPNESREIGGEYKVPYCRDCLDKIRRLLDWESNIEVGVAGWVALIITIACLRGVVLNEGWGGLLSLKVWELALGGMIMSGVFVFLILLLLMGFLISPLLLRAFPSKVASWGVVIAKNKRCGKVGKATPGIPETSIATDTQMLMFANPMYAEKFCEVNGLKPGLK